MTETQDQLSYSQKRQSIDAALAQLRQRAEAALNGQTIDPETLTHAEIEHLFRELLLHQIELEAQNEELISARAMIEAEHRRYQELFEQAPDAYLVTSLEGVIQEANHAALALFQVSHKKLIGKPLAVFIAEAGRREFRAQVNRLANAELEKVSNWDLEIFRRGDDAVLPVSVSLVLAQDPEKGVSVLRWLFRDQSHYKQAATALKHKTDELLRTNALVTALSQVAASIDAAASPDQVMRTLGEALRLHDIVSFVALLDEEKRVFKIRYTSIASKALKAAEKLAGLQADGFELPFERLPFHATLLEDQQGVYVKDPLEITSAVLPGFPSTILKRILKLSGLDPESALLYLPLTMQESVIGTLAIWGPGLRECDIPTLSIFATQVSGSLQVAHLHEQLRAKRVEEQASLLRLSRAFLDENSPQGILDIAVGETARALDVELAAIALIDPGGKTYSGRAGVNWPSEILQYAQGISLDADTGLSFAIRERTPIVIPDESRETRFGTPLWAEQMGIISSIIMPMMVGEKAAGGLIVNSRTRRDWNEDEVRLLSLIANMTAQALARVNLAQAQDNRLKKRTAAIRLSQHLLNTLEWQAVLDRVIETLVDIYQPDFCKILAHDETGDDLSLVAGQGWQPENMGRRVPAGVESQAGYTLVSKTPVVVEDFTQETRFHAPALLREHDVQAGISAPMLAGDRAIGVVSVHWRRAQHFSIEAIEILELVANLSGQALERARLFEAERIARQQAETLRQAGAAVLATLDHTQTIERILEQLALVVPYDSASVQLLTENGDQQFLKIVGGRGWQNPQDVIGMTFPVPGDNPNTVVLENGRPHIVQDIAQEYRVFSEGPHSHIHSWLGVPLITQERLIGMLTIDSTQPHRYRQEHADLVAAFGDQVAIALENARLFADTQRQLNELSLLNEISLAISMARSEGELLTSIKGIISREYINDHFCITLIDPQARIFRPICYYPDSLAEHFDRDFPITQGVMGQVAATGKPRRISDVTQEAGYVKTPDNMRSELCVPLKIAERVIGVINVESRSVAAFSKDDERLLMTLAGQLATALDRLHSEQAVRQSEIRYRSLFDGVPVGLFRSTPQGQLLDANQFLVKMLGYPDRESFLNSNVGNLYVNIEDRQHWKKLIEAEGMAQDFEVQARRYNGEIIWVEHSSRVEFDQEGNALFYEGSVIDITKRREAEVEIEHLARFPEENPNPVLRVSADGRILFANQAGLPVLKTCGCELGDPLPVKMLALALDAFEKGAAQVAEIEVGEQVFLFTLAPITEAGYVNLYGRDITDRYRAEKALQESEDHYRSLVDTAPNAILVVDDRGTIQRINRVATEIFGYQPEELIGQPVEVFLPGSFRERHIAHRKDYNANPKTRLMGAAMELMALRKDGREFPVEVSLAPVNTQAGMLVTAIVRDISEQQRARQEIDLLFSATRAISEAPDFQSALQVALALICEKTGMSFAEVWIPNHEGTLLETYPAWYQRADQGDHFRIASAAYTFPPNIGLPGRVWASKQPEWIQDIRQHTTDTFLRGQIAASSGLGSVFGVPIIEGDQVLAVAVFFMATISSEDQRLLELLSTLATQLGTALQRKLVEDEIHNNYQQQQVVNALLNTSLSDAPLHEQLGRVLDDLLEIPWFTFESVGGIFLAEGQQLRLAAQRNLPAELQAQCAQAAFGQCLCGRVAASGKPYYCGHVDELHELRYAGMSDHGHIIIPIQSGQKLLGVLMLYLQAGDRQDEGEMEFLNAVAHILAGMIERSQTASESRKLSSVVEQTADAVIITNKDGIVQYVNPAFEEITGFAPEEILGQTPRVVRSQAHDQAFYEALWNTILSGEVFRDTLINHKKSGELFYVDQTITPLLNSQGEITQFVSTWKDITGRVQAEEEIRRRAAYLQALHAIDTAISGSVDLKVTLSVLLDQVIKQLSVDAGNILLYDAKTQMLEFSMQKGFYTRALQYTQLRFGEGHAGQAALQKEIIHIPNLQHKRKGILQSPLLRDEKFIAYYGVPLIAKGRVLGVLEIFHRSPLEQNTEWMGLLEAMSTQAAIAIDNANLFNDLQRSNIDLALAYDSTLEGWAKALELRDEDTEGHTRRVTDLTLKLARKMGVSGVDLEHIRRGALLHDIGKMGIPDGILLKPGKLTEEEWDVMRKHPVYAYELLSQIPYLRNALDIPYCHHEKWDGSGYPRGLKGAEIPLAARIF
nr:GAF domain-containing protein [Anaerolineae bacterium]